MKIYLFCNLGLSTSILVDSMKKEAEKKGLDVDVKAFAISELQKYVGELDVALLGPQVGYRMKEMKKICDPFGVPIDVIPMQDYGMCNGTAVLAFALSLIEKKDGGC